MKRLLAILLLLSGPALAQFSSTAHHVYGGPTLPAHCSATSGDVFVINNTTPTQLYLCTATDTWTVAGSGSGISTCSSPLAAGTAGQVCVTGTSQYLCHTTGACSVAGDWTLIGPILTAMTQAVANSAANTVSVACTNSGTSFCPSPVTIDPSTGAMANLPSVSITGAAGGSYVKADGTGSGTPSGSGATPAGVQYTIQTTDGAGALTDSGCTANAGALICSAAISTSDLIGTSGVAWSLITAPLSTGTAAARPACSTLGYYLASDTHALTRCNTITWTVTLNPSGAIACIVNSTADAFQCYDSSGAQLIQPAGNYAPASGIALSALANQAANTVLGNYTASPAAPTAGAAPAGGTNGCSGSTDAAIYTAGTGWGCHQIAGVSANQNIREIPFTFDGGGSALSGTLTRCAPVEYAGTISGIYMVSDLSGNATLDVKTVAYASYTGPASTSTIANYPTNNPTFTGATKFSDTTLTNWTKALTANTVVCVTLSSPATITWLSGKITVNAN